jgi:molybdopterin molybdotransferase
MLSVAEAQALVLQQARPLPPEAVPLSAAAVGAVLAEDMASDLDMPPYDKALMDGYALRAGDLAQGRATLHVIEEVTAGQTPRLTVGPGQATRIMTGAPIPAGADAVVMVERTKLRDDGRVQVEDAAVRPGMNVLPRAREMRRGDVVLRAGVVLRPQEFGLLAMVGRSSVLVHPRPDVAVLPTGDEIVDVSQVPGPGQIRNSNGPMLLAQVARAGGVPRFLGIARDRQDSLRPLIQQGLESPVLILSGGVSAGKLDLVPGVLEEVGVKAHFHKVSMKPGKPVFFGTFSRPSGMTSLVFGLPGNPVSSLVCFELFVRPALRRLAGHGDAGPRMIHAELVEDFAYQSDRPTYYPVRLEDGERGWQIRPCPWFGSADLRALTQANVFAVFPAGNHQHSAGQRFPVLAVDW